MGIFFVSFILYIRDLCPSVGSLDSLARINQTSSRHPVEHYFSEGAYLGVTSSNSDKFACFSSRPCLPQRSTQHNLLLTHYAERVEDSRLSASSQDIQRSLFVCPGKILHICQVTRVDTVASRPGVRMHGSGNCCDAKAWRLLC